MYFCDKNSEAFNTKVHEINDIINKIMFSIKRIKLLLIILFNY
jgi:hypothetical protein